MSLLLLSAVNEFVETCIMAWASIVGGNTEHWLACGETQAGVEVK